MRNIDTGDAIFHTPSGETWLVAYATETHVICCGWPESWADFEDCVLKRKATPEEKFKLLLEMYPKHNKEADSRTRHARYVLEAWAKREAAV